MDLMDKYVLGVVVGVAVLQVVMIVFAIIINRITNKEETEQINNGSSGE